MIKGGDICGLVIRPGDTLLVAVDPRTSLDELHYITEWLKSHLPHDVTVVAVAASQLAVYHPDTAPDEGAACDPA